MKQLKQDDTKLPLWRARKDAEDQHARYIDTHTTEVRATAASMTRIAKSAWKDSKVFCTARAGFIAIKVSRPGESFCDISERDLLFQLVAESKAEVVSTVHNLVFRIPK